MVGDLVGYNCFIQQFEPVFEVEAAETVSMWSRKLAVVVVEELEGARTGCVRKRE